MSDLAGVLQEACDDVISDPSLAPAGGVTHCNEGAARVAEAMGCTELSGYMADEQYQIMDSNLSGCWAKVDGRTATLHALDGGLAFAAMPSHRLKEAHGHIAAIYPAAMELSGSLGVDVPMVANVGKQDREEKASAAFPVADGEPDYFTWTKEAA